VLWSEGAWLVANPLADILNPLDPWLTTPLGWRPAGSSYQVPTYPPGLPLLMSIPHALWGIDGAAAVVVASTAIAVWATGMLAGGIAGIIAAILIAFSPVFLNQSFQPMSDVPVTAAWMLCFLLVRGDSLSAGGDSRLTRGDKPLGLSLLAGMACAIAVLIRPNLAPLALVPLFLAGSKLVFAMPVALAGAVVAFVQWLWYGSPLQSGYGSARELFAFANVLPNASRYFSWLIATAPLLLLAPLGFVRLRRQPYARALLIFAALVAASYLAYAVFDQWSYLRFLLPAMGVFAVFAAIEFAAWIDRSPMAARLPIFLMLMLGAIAYGLFTARALETFRLAAQLARVDHAADFVIKTVPQDAVLIAGEQSGSMRYYTGRPILRWDTSTPDTLDAAIAALGRSGHQLYVVLDAWENEPFLDKFKDMPAVALDWPPLLDAGTSHRTRVWNLADRARFLAGENLHTVRLP
jgi:hypothetical protein